MTKRSTWTVGDYERAMTDAFREEGFEVVTRDGATFARIETTSDAGEDILSEVNLSRVSAEMARHLS